MVNSQRTLAIDLVLGFIAGAIAVPIFHQGMVYILTQVGMFQGTVFSTRPVPPFGIYTIVNQMFWGGVWGLVFVLIIDRIPAARPIWLVGLLLGAIALPMVFWFVVSPIKGNPVAAGWNPTRMLVSVLINAGWGIGLALIFLGLRRLVAGMQTSTA
jgi:hypothetical protein